MFSKNRNKKEFTLIELLVVVLIIGILAAIAFPQYQKAVVKANAMEYIPWFKRIKQGRELFILRTGNDKCMDLGRYINELGVANITSRCHGVGDGFCPDETSWCDSGIYLDDKKKKSIFNGTGHARVDFKQYGYDFQMLLLTWRQGYTSQTIKSTGQLFCKPVNEKGDTMCKILSGDTTTVKCDSTNSDCYIIPL